MPGSLEDRFSAALVKLKFCTGLALVVICRLDRPPPKSLNTKLKSLCWYTPLNGMLATAVPPLSNAKVPELGPVLV